MHQSAREVNKEQDQIEVHYLPLVVILSAALLCWFLPSPDGLTRQAWHLFVIFIGTIAGVIFRPMPVAPTVLGGMTAALLTHTLTPAQIFDAYSKDTVWLIVFSFFLARGFVKTGLAARISYYFMKLLGRSTLGMAYGIGISEVLLATMIPSLVARTGGIIYPILLATCRNLEADHPTMSVRRTCGFLMMSAFQISAVSSAMFMTAMAANPIIVTLAEEFGVTITWGSWALAALVPGVLSILIVPYFLEKIMKIEVKETPRAREDAQRKLEELGSLKFQEKSMLATAFIVLFLWIVGPMFAVSSISAAMLGLMILFVTGVLGWKDCIREETAWSTLFWLGALVSMSTGLKAVGFFSWLSEQMIAGVGGMTWWGALISLALLYFYSHYLFASNTAHVTAMFSTFLATSIAVGAPPMLAAMILAFFSSLFGGLTHYASGPAPVFYASHYLSLRRFWELGLYVSVIFLLIWLGIGPLWWKLAAYW